MTQNPKKNLLRMEKIANAWSKLAPEATFGGVKLADFEAQLNISRQKREAIHTLETETVNAIVERDTADEEGLRQSKLIVNGVIGNPDYGDNSALYEAMGFVPKSSRRSGLTRKKKIVEGK